MPHLDQIFINELRLQAIIGVYPQERLAPQPIQLDLELTVDTQQALQTDELADALDYDSLVKKLQSWSLEQSFQLVETLAHYLVDKIFACFDLEAIRLRLTKFPAGLPIASAGIVVTRYRK